MKELKKLIDEIKKLRFLDKLSLVSNIITIFTAITTLNIIKVVYNLNIDWIYAFLSQVTMYSLVFSIYIAILYFLYNNLNQLKKDFGCYFYIFIIPILLIITLFFIMGIGFINCIHFVGLD